jgi:two-component system chemotaxis response regulator CheY
MVSQMAHILISDDSIAMRQMLAYTLTEASHEVMQADNGQSALRLAQSHTFDLVITDVNMPLLDGLSLVKELRALPNYRFKPILLLTTETDPQKKQIAKKSGATGWIIKPFNPDKLLMAVRKVLG